MAIFLGYVRLDFLSFIYLLGCVGHTWRYSRCHIQCLGLNKNSLHARQMPYQLYHLSGSYLLLGGGAGQDLTVLRDFSWLHAHVIPKFTWGTICDTKIKSGLVKATTITVAISIFQSTLVKIYLYDKKTSILLRQFYRNSGK